MTELSKDFSPENHDEDITAVNTPDSESCDECSHIPEGEAAAEPEVFIEPEVFVEPVVFIEPEIPAAPETADGAEDKDEDIPALCPDDLSDDEFDEYFASISIPDFEDVPDDDERYISNSSRKRAFLEEKQAADQACAPAAPAKKTFRGVISNFVYHHRILSLLIAAAVIAAAVWGGVVCIRGSADYNIGIYTESMSFTREQLSAIEQSLAAYGKDINGDGRVTVRARAYNPVGDDTWTFFTQTAYLKRDLYGDGKHGSRVNDILITDKAVSDILCSSYGTNFFDKLNGDEYWVDISDAVLPDGLPDELGIMLLSRNMYVDREISVPRYNNARGLIEEIAESNDGLFDF